MMKVPGIIVGVDGSALSRKALEWAVREAGIRNTALTVLTVRQAGGGFLSAKVDRPVDDDSTERARKNALAEVEEVLDQAVGGGRPMSVAVQAVVGVPAEELLRAAVDADMIVVGARGAGGFRRLLLGSVSSQVVHHGDCPVVVIPSGT
jgi:nucleotide-binding universal stress UspA family protein